MLANKQFEKVLTSNYPPTKHLAGSKMINDEDRLINIREEELLTKKTRELWDRVIVTEKVDGCNVGILKRNGKLHPIIRKGYDVRTNSMKFIQEFADFVEINKDRFMQLLGEEERICAEWMPKTHTIRYKMKHEPFIAFDILKTEKNKRETYLEFLRRTSAVGIVTAGLVHYGTAIETKIALKMLGEGFHGAIDGVEGIVYRYESHIHGFLFTAKYVSNPLLGNQEIFKENIENEKLYNKYKL